jgi:hypothetical protein
LAFLAAAGALRWWGAAALVRWQVNRQLGRYWEGSASVAGVDFRYFGPLVLRGIVLRDDAGREWARIALLEIGLRNWPGLRPVVTDLFVEGVDLRAYGEGGRCRPPWRRPEQAGQPSPYVDMRHVAVGDASLSVFDEKGLVWSAGGFQFTAEGNGGGYDISCLRRGGGSADGFAFAGHSASTDPADLRGRGQVRLEDTAVRRLPIVSDIMAFLGLNNSADLGRCGLEAAFELAGPVATIQHGRVASAVLGLEAERGGTVDLATGMMDFYVVAAPLAEVRSLLPLLPPAGVLGQLTDELLRGLEAFSTLAAKLTRLHVKGHWGDPREKLLTKEPLKDLQAGTVDFIRQAIETGGRLPAGTLKAFGDLLEGLQPASRPASKPANH